MKDIRSRLAILPLGCLLLAAVAAGAPAAPPQHAGFPAWTPLAGLQAEGVAVAKSGDVYVTVRQDTNGLVYKYDLFGEPTLIAQIGPGMIGGLAITAEGELYAAVALGPARGVYLVTADGDTRLVPGTDKIAFANALAFDRRGTLYITESYSLTEAGTYGPGGVWVVPRGGEAVPWLRDDLLTGIGAVLGYPVGANGIGLFGGDLYVVNTDKGIVVRIPVARGGGPGTPEVWTHLANVPGSPLAGSPFPPMGDGLALDAHGNVYVAVVSRCAVVRLNADDRSQETVALFQFGPPDLPLNAPLDTPASLAFGTGAGEQQQLFVTNLGMMPTIAPGPPWPGSGLVKIFAGAPGLPLR